MSTPTQVKDDGTTRAFASGATRNTAEGKLDIAGALAPDLLVDFVTFLHGHRKQPDGTMRDAGNWRRGFPKDDVFKSLTRHFFAAWSAHDQKADPEEIRKDLMAVLFNTFAYLDALKKEEKSPKVEHRTPQYGVEMVCSSCGGTGTFQCRTCGCCGGLGKIFLEK